MTGCESGRTFPLLPIGAGFLSRVKSRGGEANPQDATGALDGFRDDTKEMGHREQLSQKPQMRTTPDCQMTARTGLVVTRDGTISRMRPGDTVYTPPGEEHWHGATGDGTT
jgi:hypothetical protein